MKCTCQRWRERERVPTRSRHRNARALTSSNLPFRMVKLGATAYAAPAASIMTTEDRMRHSAALSKTSNDQNRTELVSSIHEDHRPLWRHHRA